jgi:GNAT superfamily N-acetyltransferase
MLGVAAWLPPEPVTASRKVRLRASAATARVRLLFPRAAPALGAGFETLGSHHPPDPHWYLAFVGIDPDQQGRGLGRQLLSPILDRADRESSICYLETPFPDTRTFYRRLGFDDTCELNPVPQAPAIWTMTRQPG